MQTVKPQRSGAEVCHGGFISLLENAGCTVIVRGPAAWTPGKLHKNIGISLLSRTSLAVGGLDMPHLQSVIIQFL